MQIVRLAIWLAVQESYGLGDRSCVEAFWTFGPIPRLANLSPPLHLFYEIGDHIGRDLKRPFPHRE